MNEELPGHLAHAQMAPGKRPTASAVLKKGIKPKLSAVLILFYPSKDLPHFSLIQRPIYQGVHSGQISFPGGKIDEEDDNLKETALRETWEEIGVPKEKINILSELTDVYIPPSNFLVTPFVGFCAEEPVFKIDPIEVEEMIAVPFTVLMDDKMVKSKDMKFNQNSNTVKVPYYDILNRTVWGATAVILSEVKEILNKFYANPE